MFLLNVLCGHLIYCFILCSYLTGMLFILTFLHVFQNSSFYDFTFNKVLVRNSIWDGFSVLNFVNNCLFPSIWPTLENVSCTLKCFCNPLFIHAKDLYIYEYICIYSLLICYFVDSRILINYPNIILFLLIFSFIFITVFMILRLQYWVNIFICNCYALILNDPFINNLIFSLLAAICMDIGFHLLPFSLNIPSRLKSLLALRTDLFGQSLSFD